MEESAAQLSDQSTLLLIWLAAPNLPISFFQTEESRARLPWSGAQANSMTMDSADPFVVVFFSSDQTVSRNQKQLSDELPSDSAHDKE